MIKLQKKKRTLDWDTINLMKILKIAVGSSIAIIIANLLGLEYSASAGIITLLSIQDTKKETLIVAGRRFLAFLFAIVIAYVLFESFGYYTITFGAFLFLFVSGSYILGLQDGIAMCSVLTTHFLIEKTMVMSFIGNEIMIMLIGTLVGVILNMYMPKNKQSVQTDIYHIEEVIKKILGIMATIIMLNKDQTMDNNQNYSVKNDSLDKEFESLDLQLKESTSRAYNNMNNTLLSDTRYYIQYFVMRKTQSDELKRMQVQLSLLTLVPKQAIPISEFINHIAKHFHEYNNAEKLLLELAEIKLGFKDEPNPETRLEFENRAILFLILNELEDFLIIKRDFVRNLDEKQIEKYWKVQILGDIFSPKNGDEL